MDYRNHRKFEERLFLMADNIDNPLKRFMPSVIFSNSNNKENHLKNINNDLTKKESMVLFKNVNASQNSNLPVNNTSFLLHQAASEGSIDQVKSLIKELGNSIKEIDCINLQGFTPLHLASRFNRVNVIVFLLDNGSWVDKPSKEEKNTPLHFAAKYSMTAATKCLCERGADVKLKNTHGSTALHLAARRGNEEICRILINHGSDVNATDSGNCTPLHMAILACSEVITKLLIKNGADVNAKDGDGEGPIHYAAAMNQESIIILLTKGALVLIDEEKRDDAQRKYVNLRTDKKDTALHIAARAGYLDTVKTLVSIGANVNICSATDSTPLHLAVINGDKDMVEYLLEHNAKVNVYDHQNMSPAHKASQFGRFDVIKLLVEKGAQIDSIDSSCFTPLMWAVLKGQNDIVEYLLKCKADVTISEMNMKSILHLAIENCHSSTLQLLIKNGCSSLINKPDKDFKRPLHYAAISNDVESIKILIQVSADIDVTDNEEKTALHTAAEYGHFNCLITLVQTSARNINGMDEKGRSPLHLAAKNGWIKTTLTLIEMGAQISGRDDSSWTPLDYAARNGHSKVVVALINNGASVDGFDPNKLTPLHHASINGHVDCINVLLNHGASISFQNKDGKNCLDLAIENNRKEACVVFVKHDRWKEALNHFDNEGFNPMEKLISSAPDIAKIVLDRCVEYSKIDEKLEEYYICYDFQYLDFPPDCNFKRHYFGPSSMVAYNCESLLSHPLTVQLINDKWTRLGRWIHLISLFIYIMFVSMLTGLLIIDKTRVRYNEKNLFQKIIPIITLALSVFEILKEIVQAYILRKEYLNDLSNYLELMLYSSSFIFMIPFIMQLVDVQKDSTSFKIQQNVKWSSGAVAIFFAWTNLLLYLKRNTFFGVYVIMIIEVFKSLTSVTIVFFMIVVAFSLTFFVLLGNQSAFLYPGRSILKTIAMTLGENDYDITFAYNSTTNLPQNKDELPYPEMSYVLFTLFLIVCPILLMNLLVGLAVGNIADVRKSAYILMLKAQVDILKALESRYPKKLLKKIYCRQLIIYPNKVSWKKRILNWFSHSSYDSLKDEQEKRSRWKTDLTKELELQRMEFDIERKKMKYMKSLLKEHLEITKELAVTLKIDENSFESNGKHINMDSNSESLELERSSYFDETDIKLANLSHDKEINKDEFANFGNANETDLTELLAHENSKGVNLEKTDKKKLTIYEQQSLSNKNSKTSVKLRNLKPRVEDEREGLVHAEIQSSDTSSLQSENKDNQKDSLDGKKRISMFNFPKWLKDYSNGKVEQSPKPEKETEGDFSRFSLHLAAKEGTIGRIQHIIENNKKQNSVTSKEFISTRDGWNKNGFSALHLAARYNQKDVVAYLLENGSLIDSPDRDDGNTALLLAAKYGMTTTASFLIEKGANVMFKNNYGTTALHYACRRGNKKLLLKILSIPNVDINVQDINLNTPLHLAMNGGCIRVVSTLINYGANVFAINNKGEIPIHYAAASTVDNIRDELNKGDYFVLEEISNKTKALQHVPSSIVEDLIELLIKGALKNVPKDKHEQQRNAFVNSKTKENHTPLHIAACCGNEKSLHKLLRVGGDVNAQTDSGLTPLHFAAMSGHERVVNFLIMYDANIQAVDNDLMTPLHRACLFGRLSVVKLLDEKGALLEVKDKNNFTPVICAVCKGHIEVITYLIARGVQINSTDVNNKNALHVAVKENQLETLKFLLDNHQFKKMNDSDKDNRAPVHYAAADGNLQALEFLIQKNAPIDVGDNQERTPLHLASEKGHLSCVKLLISTSAGEINSTDAHGMTPLHLAASNDHRKVVNLLIESGADVSLRDNCDWSPLDYAAKNGHEKSLQILLENGAFINACDKNGYTPLHHAALAGHVECIVALLDQGANIQLLTKERKNCLYLAVENSEREAGMAIVKHKRWHEALLNIDSKRAPVMEKIIELAPEVAEVALDNCITYSDLDKKHSDYSIEYNFQFVDTDPINSLNSFFAPSLIVQYKRGKLLSHPLVVELINQRWSRMGRWVYLSSLSFYLVFVSLLTALVVIERMSLNKQPTKICSGKKFTDIITWSTLGIACIQILWKLILTIYIGISYINNPVKILEFFLYISTALFMVPFITCQFHLKMTNLESMKWQSGSLSILLAWSKILLYLENLPFIGLYIVMFTEVLYTLLKVLLVFGTLLIGFGLSFYALLDLQSAFSDYGRSIVKTFVMMLGEISYDSIFTNNYSDENSHLLPNLEISIVIFLLFAMIMIIVVMNLLVGLAVGDIESVRNNAYLRVLQRQVYFLSILDRTYPKFIRKFVYKASYIQKPNQKSWFKKFILWLGNFQRKALEEEQTDAKKDLIMLEIASNKEAIIKQKKKTKSILDDLEKQLKRTKKIAKFIATSSSFKNKVD
ncbi:uncharacterized protein LOC100203916 isoform X1 [Hydra vulgaris]|uniref:uncharacterized protein LOC100203916 isoform X1 n=1 Tax=Hydra vulgaris TaxID=6087 RepID=UPI0032E9D971